MHKLFRSLVAFAAISFAVAPAAAAGELVIRIADGRATVIARDVPVNQILAEWARVGNTRVVNGEKLAGGPVTLELIDLPEKQALDILLRSAAGYMTAPRAEPVAGASLYDRVVILATSHAPATPPPVPQPFGRPVVQPVFPQPQTDDQGNEIGEQGPVPPPGMMPPPPAGPYPVPAGQYPTGPYPMPGQYPMPAGQYPPPAGMPMANPDMPVQQGPITSPRPGMLPPQPQPQPTPIMPYNPSGPVPPPPTP